MKHWFARDLPESVIKSLSIRARELGAVNLGQGIPSFATAPEVIEATGEALKDEHIGVYPNFLGDPELREAIAQRLNRQKGLQLSGEKNILVSVGAMEGTATVIMSLVTDGDRVGVITPDYCNHFPQVQLARGEAVEIPMREGWRPDLELVEREAKEGLKLLILTNPNNPTGTVWRKEELERLAGLAEKYDFWVLADETYEFLTYESESTSLLDFWDKTGDKLIVVRSFSKEFAMTGWRVGYVVARPELIKVFAKTHDALTGCAPKVSQRAALAALATQEETVKKQVEMYKTRRKLACEALAKIDGLNFVRPEGAYYILVDYPGEVDSMQMSEQLLTEAKVAVVPRGGFGRAGEGQERVAVSVGEGGGEVGNGNVDKNYFAD